MYRHSLWFIVAFILSFGVIQGQAAIDEAFGGLDGDIFARIHFVGSAQVSADPEAAELNKLTSVPSFTALREGTLQKISTAPYRLLKSKIAADNTNDFSALIRPMVDDVVTHESYVEFRNVGSKVPEMMLAVKVPNDRAVLWQAYLTTILVSWTGMHMDPIQGDGYTGFELKKHENPNLIRFIHTGEWVLFGWGQDDLRLQPALLERIKATKRPVDPLNGKWLDVLFDLPAWNASHPISFPLPLPESLPKLHLTVEGRKNYARPEITMLFPKPLNVKLEPWKIPAKYVHNPMASFTAVRGISGWLDDIPDLKKANLSPLPNQIITWSIPDSPFSFFGVAPVPNARGDLGKLSPFLVARLNGVLTNLQMTSPAVWTNSHIAFTMPFIAGSVTNITSPPAEFLYYSSFPLPLSKNASSLPTNLVHELDSKKDLVFYSWELNSERMVQWRSLEGLYLAMSSTAGPTKSSLGFAWLEAVRTNLLNCGTEVTLTAPNQLTAIRNSPLGLSGLEMIALEYWIDADEFPLNCNYHKKLAPGRRTPGAIPGPPGIMPRPPNR